MTLRAVLLAVALSGACLGAAQSVGAPAPDFTLVGRDGAPVRLSELRGTPVLVNVWATWCGPCKAELPVFQQAHDELGDALHLLLLNHGEDAADVAAYLRSEGLDMPVALTPTRDQAAELRARGLEPDDAIAVARTYRVFGLPSTYLVGPDGTLQATHIGPLDASALSDMLATVGATWAP